MKKLIFLFLILIATNVFAGGVDFDGTDDLIECTNDSSIDLGNEDQSFYVRFRSSETSAGDYYLFTNGERSYGGTACWAYVFGALEGIACAVSSTGGGGNSQVAPSGSPVEDWNDGEWHTMVLVRDISEANELLFYFDGEYVTAADDGNKSTGLVGESLWLAVANEGPSSTLQNYFGGDISEFAAWSRVLTAQEAAILGKSGLKGLPSTQMGSSLEIHIPLVETTSGSTYDGATARTFGAYGGTCTADDGANNTGLDGSDQEGVYFQ